MGENEQGNIPLKSKSRVVGRLGMRDYQRRLHEEGRKGGVITAEQERLVQ